MKNVGLLHAITPYLYCSMLDKSNLIYAAGFNAMVVALFSLLGCILEKEPVPTGFQTMDYPGVKYYLNGEVGDDNNSGSKSSPFKSLGKIASLDLKDGDTVFLAAGSVFYGALELNDAHGSERSPIVITNYGPEGEKALIDAKGFANGILLENCSHIRLENIDIKADGGGFVDQTANMRCGVLIRVSKQGAYNNVTLDRLTIHDVFFEEQGFVRDEEDSKTSNGDQSYGWGIRLINQQDDAVMENVIVSNCEVRNVSHTGIKFTGKNRNIRNIRVSGNRVTDTGGPGIQAGNIADAVFNQNYIDFSGCRKDLRNWGRGSGLWTWSASDVVIEHNTFMNANGPNDSAGCHIDFNCENVVVQYNFSANNAGGFCQILGRNYNCAYRYNVSVNDGWRRKGVNDALQDGRLFWLSGHNGGGNGHVGPFNSYFYNNTMYVSKELVAKFAVIRSARGVLVANNIFYLEGGSEGSSEGIYTLKEGAVSPVVDVVFKNNLYLAPTDWPANLLIQEGDMRIGDASFVNKGSLKIPDYAPTAVKLVKNQGIEIPNIPNDGRGLTVGLKVEKDILGNPIIGKPDMGAIEMN